ncbi:MAG: MFS transporter [Gammaproteobacteria bacterium]|nr:MFS transporter [Gammaproteobacteria bacterium]
MPYWRLSGFYLFYFASLGALLPYWGLYLKSVGFTAQDIGLFMAVVMGTKIISPNVWGWIADHTGKRMRFVRWGCALGAVCFAGVFAGSHYWWLLLVMVSFSFFWNATLPQFEATTFTFLGNHTHRYSSIRLWGSIGFIITAAGLGHVLHQLGINTLPLVLLILFVGIWGMSLLVPEQAAGHKSIQNRSLTSVMKQPRVLALLAVCLLMQMSHGPYYTFYTIYLEESGYSPSLIGWLWALGVIAEVVAFLLMHRLVPRLGVKLLLWISLVLAALRWLLIGNFVDSLAVLVVAQILHAASFGIYHASAIQLIHQYFSGHHQGKGQALYSSLSFGLGGAIGSFYSGLIWESMGAPTVFAIASISVILGAVVSWIWLRPDMTHVKEEVAS